MWDNSPFELWSDQHDGEPEQQQRQILCRQYRHGTCQAIPIVRALRVLSTPKGQGDRRNQKMAGAIFLAKLGFCLECACYSLLRLHKSGSRRNHEIEMVGSLLGRCTCCRGGIRRCRELPATEKSSCARRRRL